MKRSILITMILFPLPGLLFGMIDTGQPYPVVLPFKDFEQYDKSNKAVSIRSKGLMIK